MRKRLLIFSWEYHGYHSIRGAALSRRVKQVAEDFEKNGWEVVVVYNDHRQESGTKPFLISAESPGITRIAVHTKEKIYEYDQITFFRRLQTLYYVALYGDRSFLWAREVINHFPEFGIKKPDLIISFFTPRAPLFLGNHFSKKLNVPWIADFQDPFDEGLSDILKYWSKQWTKRTLKSAKARVHVSPEWAERDGKALGLKIHAIRHAVPESKIDGSLNHSDNRSETFKLFYGGSLNVENQWLNVLKEVLLDTAALPRQVELVVAGTPDVYDAFKNALSPAIKVTNLGWLSNDEYLSWILKCNCSLVIPWATSSKQVIPSKFYELCSLKVPIWIVGNDTGSFTFLLNEWMHPEIPFADVRFQRKALIAACNNDYSLMFNIKNCSGKYITENDLFSEYMSFEK